MSDIIDANSVGYEALELRRIERDRLAIVGVAEGESKILQDLQNGPVAIKPEFMVKFGVPGEQILQASLDPKVDLIVLGLKHHTQTDAGQT